MPAAARKGDSCTGHGLYPPRASSGGSPDVFIEGAAALRVGDPYPAHCNPDGICHAGSQGAGSASVFVNGQPLARAGDAVSCGGAVANGAATVFVGG